MNNLAIAAVFCIVAVYSLGGVETQSTASLMCYNCTYITTVGFELGDAGCKDPFISSGINKIACDGSCVKRELKGDTPTVMRTCFTAAEGKCAELSNFEISAGNTIAQNCCTKNLCNSAGALAFDLFVAVVALCGALAVKY